MATSKIEKPNIYFVSPYNQDDNTIETLVNKIIATMTVDGLYIAGDTWKGHSLGYHAECIRKGYRLSGIIYEYANNTVYTFTTREESGATIKIKTVGGGVNARLPMQCMGALHEYQYNINFKNTEKVEDNCRFYHSSSSSRSKLRNTVQRTTNGYSNGSFWYRHSKKYASHSDCGCNDYWMHSSFMVNCKRDTGWQSNDRYDIGKIEKHLREEVAA